jgi:hypothetical protein
MSVNIVSRAGELLIRYCGITFLVPSVWCRSVFIFLLDVYALFVDGSFSAISAALFSLSVTFLDVGRTLVLWFLSACLLL